MHTKSYFSRTVGRQTARLLAGLYDRSKSTFTLADVRSITGLSTGIAAGLVNKAVQRGLFSRLKGGLYMVVPPDAGAGYAGNPLLVARDLAGDAPGFVSHASAMEVHRLVTQPQFAVYYSSARRIRGRTVQGVDYRFVSIKPGQLFGAGRHWVTKQEHVAISDLERTILDGLRQPEYCGGIAEVAKGLWMRHDDVSIPKLVDYALRLGIGAVTRRLGYLLELYELGVQASIDELRTTLSATYVPLDPTLPRHGQHQSRWRVQANIGADELLALRSS